MSLHTPPLTKIAEKAGVSKAAVSMALRNHPRISQARKEQILKIAEEMGYRPNPMVSSLMTQIRSAKKPRTGSTLAVLGPAGTLDDINNNQRYPYRYELHQAIIQRAKSLGYSVELISMDDPEITLQQQCRVLSYRGIRGLLIPPFPKAFVGKSLDIDPSEFATVVIGQSQHMPGFHRVAHDQFAVGRGLMEQALARGYHRIGLRMQPAHATRVGHYYIGAFYESLYASLPKQVASRFVLLRETFEAEQLIQWIQKNRIDCLISQHEGDIKFLKQNNYKMPDDIGFAILDCSVTTRKVSGMIHDPQELGTAAVDLMNAQLQRNEVGMPKFPKTVLTQPRWHEGETLRKIEE